MNLLKLLNENYINGTKGITQLILKEDCVGDVIKVGFWNNYTNTGGWVKTNITACSDKFITVDLKDDSGKNIKFNRKTGQEVNSKNNSCWKIHPKNLDRLQLNEEVINSKTIYFDKQFVGGNLNGLSYQKDKITYPISSANKEYERMLKDIKDKKVFRGMGSPYIITSAHMEGAEKLMEEDNDLIEIHKYLEELTPEDEGVHTIGKYVVMFEGFSDLHVNNVYDRTKLPKTDFRYLAKYDDIYDEIYERFSIDANRFKLIHVENGMAGTHSNPIVYSIFCSGSV